MPGHASIILLSIATAVAGVTPPPDRRTLSANVYTDHFERRLGPASVASHTIGYTSSIDVATAEYGHRGKRCQFSFGNFMLTRRFTYDILHQRAPYGVKHMQLGTRTWVRASPAANGDVKGSCAAVFARVVAPAAAAANTLGSWKDVIDQDDAVIRRSTSLSATINQPMQRSRGAGGASPAAA